MTEEYVELHAASAFSFLEGASQPETLIERAVALDCVARAGTAGVSENSLSIDGCICSEKRRVGRRQFRFC
jgi:hypothetical protein